MHIRNDQHGAELTPPQAGHTSGEAIRVSDFQSLLTGRGDSLTHTIEVLTAMGILADDRTVTFDAWLQAKLDGLAPAIAAQAEQWARVLRDGSPRRRPRREATAVTYLKCARPALLAWSRTYDHLREVTYEDVLAHLAPLRGGQRLRTLVALRSLFTWARRDGVIFRNPASRTRAGQRPLPVWQPLTSEDLTATVQAATTPQARLCVALAAIHAARAGQIRALQLSDADLGNRRITIAGQPRPLDDLFQGLASGRRRSGSA